MSLLAPETINIRALPAVALAEKGLLPNVAAIYFVLNADHDVQYIGRASSLCFRWTSHHMLEELRTLPDVRIAYLVMDDPDDLPSLEKECIAHFVPPLNRLGQYRPKTNGMTYKKKLLRIPAEILEALEEESDFEDMSENAKLVQALREWVKAKRQRHPPAAPEPR